jgi:hypothetical protein
MASTKGRFFACSASVGAFLGAAAALVPASCGGSIQTGTGAAGTGGTGGTGNTGTGGTIGTGGTMSTSGTGGTGGTMSTSGTGGTGGTGGMVPDGGQMIHDASSELDGTLIDLDGQADSPHVPPDGGDVDGS